MKRLAVIVLALAACTSSAPSVRPNGQLTGAVGPRQAVDMFLGAVRAQDLQAMSVVWGTSKGPARDVVPRSQLEKRELVMQCYLSHDKFQILSETPGPGGSRIFGVSLVKGAMTRETTVQTVRGPSDRWYVQDVNLEPLKDLCASS